MSPQAEGGWKEGCGKRDQTEGPLLLVAALQEEVGRLSSTREPERDMDRRSRALPSLTRASQLGVAAKEAGPGSALCQEEGSVSRGGRRSQRGAVRETPPYPLRYPYRRARGPGMTDEVHNDKEEEPAPRLEISPSLQNLRCH